MAKEPVVIQLRAYINEDNRLIVTFDDADRGPAPLRADGGLDDLLLAHPGASSLTVEVRDFFQRGTVYTVYGATLESQGSAIFAHWEPTGNGQRYVLSPESDASRLRFVIGAIPRNPGAAVPIPLAPEAAQGGSLPIGSDNDRGGP